jgi:hypothetical protein
VVVSPAPPYSSVMDQQARPGLAPPAGLRPAQLGVIFVGRVTLGHIGATVVDLAGRGYLSIEPVDDDPADWRLTDLGSGPHGLLGYERVLLRGLFDGPTTIRLAQITARMVPVLDKVRAEVLRDASGAGMLGPGLMRAVHVGPWRPRARDRRPRRRTKAGRELLGRIQVFRRELRSLARDQDSVALAQYAPYAMIFGLNAPLVTTDCDPAQPPSGTDPREHTTAFAACWKKAWEAASPSNEWRLQWSNVDLTHSHGHASHDHGYSYDHGGGHGGHGGGHGGFGGGHV